MKLGLTSLFIVSSVMIFGSFFYLNHHKNNIEQTSLKLLSTKEPTQKSAPIEDN